MKDMTLADGGGGQDTLDAVPVTVTEVTEKTVHSAADFLIAYATPEGITSMSCHQLLATCSLCYPEGITSMSCRQLLATCSLYGTPEGMTSMSCGQLLATCSLSYS